MENDVSPLQQSTLDLADQLTRLAEEKAKYAEAIAAVAKIEAEESLLKKAFFAAYPGIESFGFNHGEYHLQFTKVENLFDQTRFAAENPSLYRQYKTKTSGRITVKKINHGADAPLKDVQGE